MSDQPFTMIITPLVADADFEAAHERTPAPTTEQLAERERAAAAKADADASSGPEANTVPSTAEGEEH